MSTANGLAGISQPRPPLEGSGGHSQTAKVVFVTVQEISQQDKEHTFVLARRCHGNAHVKARHALVINCEADTRIPGSLAEIGFEVHT